MNSLPHGDDFRKPEAPVDATPPQDMGDWQQVGDVAAAVLRKAVRK
jgi:hypothetical protein